jgi:hypothetical protein
LDLQHYEAAPHLALEPEQYIREALAPAKHSVCGSTIYYYKLDSFILEPDRDTALTDSYTFKKCSYDIYTLSV